MNKDITKIDITSNPKAVEALKAFMAEKANRRLEQEEKAAEYASKLQKPAV